MFSSFDWSYPAACLWGLLVLISLAGWGQLIGDWLVSPGRGERPWGWGMAAAWGMAVFLVLSGPLILLSVFSAKFVALFLFAGAVLAAWYIRSAWEDRPWVGPANPALKVLLIGLLLFAGLTYAGAVAAHGCNVCDDFVAYFAHAKMLLDAGTLYDPFSFRLMGSLGGQQTLSTLILAFLPWKYDLVLDRGIALLIVLGLTQEMVSGASGRAWAVRLVLVALALTFPIPRINSASELTGTVLFLALLRSFDLVSERRCVGWRSALLLGGLVTAAATLRCHNIFVLAVLGLGFIAWRWWEGEQDKRAIIREALTTLMIALILLAPWWIVSYRSSGIFLYPLVKGTQRPEFETFNLHLPLLATLQFIGGFFISTIYLLLFSPLLLLKAGRQRRFLFILGAALLLISTAFVSQYTYGTYFDLYRYLVPIGLALSLYSAGVVARQFIATPPTKGDALPGLRTVLTVTLAGYALFFQSFTFRILVHQNLVFIRWQFDAKRQLLSFEPPASNHEVRREYPEALAQVPSGNKTLVALDYPFLLDYRAHPIFNLDVAGAASPEPGMPFFQGPEALKKYLLAQGIHYIAQVPFDHSTFLYSRKIQTKNLAGPVPMWRFYATFELDFFANVDQLAKSNRILYDSPTIRIIALND